MIYNQKKLNRLSEVVLRLIFCALLIIFYSCSSKSMKFRYDGHIYIKVNFDDKIRGNFIYDTGAPMLVIDTLFYKKNPFRFKEIQFAEMGGVGNTMQTVKLVKDTIQYETKFGIEKSGYNILMDLKNILGKNIDGIAGVESFDKKPHKINYISKHISQVKKIKGFEKIIIEYDDYRIFVPISIQINDSTKVVGKFLLDLGSNTTTLVKNSMNINSVKKINYISRGGAGGESSGNTFYAEKLSIGKFIIKHFPIDMSKDTLGAMASNLYLGKIGNDLLDDFDVILDLPNKNLFLRPNKNFNKNPSFLFKGFSFIDRTDINQGWRVATIYEESDAYKSGLRINDQITSINDKSVYSMDKVKILQKLEPNQQLKIQILRDNEILFFNFILNTFLVNEK